MLARWYSLFLGFLLVVMGIAALVAPRVVGFGTAPLVTVGVIWLITGIVALWYGFRVRNIANVRSFAGIIGGLYFLWGIIQLFSAPAAAGPASGGLLASLAGLILLLGALGLSAGLVPAGWLHEGEVMMPGRAV